MRNVCTLYGGKNVLIIQFWTDRSHCPLFRGSIIYYTFAKFNPCHEVVPYLELVRYSWSWPFSGKSPLTKNTDPSNLVISKFIHLNRTLPKCTNVTTIQTTFFTQKLLNLGTFLKLKIS